jgi:rRNA maturation endonuclease Nob1
MAFFDDLGKKISQGTQSVVQKTKNMTDVARINGMISDEEKKINSTYLQIGKLFYAKYRNNCDSEFAGMVAAVADSESKIAEYRQQIKDIKGITHCEKCGAEVPVGAQFCNACGNRMSAPAVADPNMVKCPACGAMIDKNMRFCTSCGQAMTVVLASAAPAAPVTPAAPVAPVAPVVPAAPASPAAPAAPVEPIAAPAAPVEPVAPAVKRCPACGAELEPDSLFCTQCGAKLG